MHFVHFRFILDMGITLYEEYWKMEKIKIKKIDDKVSLSIWMLYNKSAGTDLIWKNTIYSSPSNKGNQILYFTYRYEEEKYMKVRKLYEILSER